MKTPEDNYFETSTGKDQPKSFNKNDQTRIDELNKKFESALTEVTGAGSLKEGEEISRKLLKEDTAAYFSGMGKPEGLSQEYWNEFIKNMQKADEENRKSLFGRIKSFFNKPKVDK